jgi:DNA-binding XRE family transcriptional regulator
MITARHEITLRRRLNRVIDDYFYGGQTQDDLVVNIVDVIKQTIEEMENDKSPAITKPR